MADNLLLTGDEISRKAAAIRTLSLLWTASCCVGQVVIILVWLFNPFFIVLPLSLMALTSIAIGVATYWLNRSGRVKLSGYFFTIAVVLFSSAITPLFGGFIGPLPVVYIFAILVAGVMINIRASFYVAALSATLYLATIGIENTGLLSSVIKPEAEAVAVPYITVVVFVLFFFTAAFMSWFAASRLQQALRDARSYAAELQAANEKLQASEEELRVSNEELAAANEELQEAQDHLVRTERLAAIGQLAGGVGHELRNPLGAIKNAIYYIRGRLAKSELVEKEPRVMEFLEIVDDEVGASNKIINDLLGFSRVSKPTVAPAPVKGLIAEALSKIPIPENVQLRQNIGSDSTEVAVDAEQIQQVLANVITNAVQAMPEGGRLTISSREGNGFQELEIADTGGGIAEENKDKIFEPLFTTRAKGIGLGLAVSKSIIDRHGGQIEARSMAGRGTTFTIRLPLAAAVQEGIVGQK